MNQLSTPKMTHADLFTGLGGFSLAARWAGWRTLWHLERDRFCRAVLARQFPTIPTHADIHTFRAAAYRGSIDILTGGFPCQPASKAGARRGSADDRYLWPEMFRCVTEIRPPWVVAENVADLESLVSPGPVTELGKHATVEQQEDFLLQRIDRGVLDSIVQDLEQAGYDVQPVVIPACAIGASHTRARLWIIGYSAPADRLRRELVGREDEEHAGEGGLEAFRDAIAVGSAAAAGGDAADAAGVGRQGGFTWGAGAPEERSPTDIPGPRWAIPVPRQAVLRKPPGLALSRGLEGLPPGPLFCRVDDGLSTWVDGLGWRTSAQLAEDRIHALGNAIQPQVAFRIFEALNLVTLPA